MEGRNLVQNPRRTDKLIVVDGDAVWINCIQLKNVNQLLHVSVLHVAWDSYRNKLCHSLRFDVGA